MKLNYHPDTDSLYIALSPNPSADINEVAEGVVLGFDANGRLVDIDNASHKARPPRTHHRAHPRSSHRLDSRTDAESPS